MPLYALGEDQPRAADPSWIAPDAHVIGKVELGADVGVWFGAVLRGDNETIAVGAGSNIQEGAMVHTDQGYPVTIGHGCTIGHHAIVGSPAKVVRMLDAAAIAGLRRSAESYVANARRFASQLRRL